MIIRILIRLFLAALLILTFGCERDIDLLDPATNPPFPEVFLDEFVSGLDYSAFANSKLDAFEIDDAETYSGTKSLKITVPYLNDPAGWFAGGAFYSKFPRDLSGYNALTFWAKASKPTYAEIGFGNDNMGDPTYQVSQGDVLFGSTWQKYIIPIPLAEKLTAETGMFYYAAGPDDNGLGCTIWFDEVQYENVGTIAYPRIIIDNPLLTGWVGRVFDVNVSGVTFNVDGTDQTLSVASSYFSLSSLNPSVATITTDNKINCLSNGTAKILVQLGSAAQDTITVQIEEGYGPTTPAPTPTISADSVLSMFSNAYTNHPGIVWNTFWQYSTAQTEDIEVAGDDIKLYTELNFVGIEFTAPTLNASDMTHFHMDIWTPNPTAGGQTFKVLLVDFGADGVFGGSDDTSHELTFTAPTLATQEWVSLDIPLADFTGLTATGHLAQLVLSGDLPTVFVDNVYFYIEGDDGGTPTEPESAAPAPAYASNDVISLFSDTYSDVTVDTWSAVWDAADVEDIQIEGNDTKLYTNLTFAGIEFTSQTIDATDMTHFRMDIWTPDDTADPTIFKIKLVDFGANGSFDGGDDTEHELIFNATSTPALETGTWITFDIPLTEFENLTTQAHMAQLIISGDGVNTVYVDNILFHK